MMETLCTLTAQLSAAGHSVSCAESCTGGLLAAELTRLAGSSAWFKMGFVTYSNESKQQLLKVTPETLRHYGAVSEETVREMALGALMASKADLAVSISGIAGPDGGSDDKPVGTVWFGVATKKRIYAHCRQFDGNRDEVRRQAVAFALAFLKHIHSAMIKPA